MIRQASTVTREKKPQKGFGFLKIVVITITLLFVVLKGFKACSKEERTYPNAKNIFTEKTIHLKKGEDLYVDFGRSVGNSIIDYWSPDNNVKLLVTSISGNTARPFEKSGLIKIYSKTDTGAWLRVDNMDTTIKITFK
jgi:hypothetical protein